MRGKSNLCVYHIILAAMLLTLPIAADASQHMWQIDSDTDSITASKDYLIKTSGNKVSVSKNGAKEKTYAIKNTVIAVVPSPSLPVIAIFTAEPETIKQRTEDNEAMDQPRDLDVYIDEIIFITLTDGKRITTTFERQEWWNYDDLFDIWSPDGVYAAIKLSSHGPVAVYDFKSRSIEPVIVQLNPVSCSITTSYECIKWTDKSHLEIITAQCDVFEKFLYSAKNQSVRKKAQGNAARLRCE